MASIRRLCDNRISGSMASEVRRKRFAQFRSLLETVPRPLRILDVGGTQRFWEVMGFTDEPGVHIDLLNVTAPPVTHPNLDSLAGDATDLSCFADGAYDVVFSNSVIEHVGGFAAQKRMAEEVRRVGKRYFLQTPNFFFPIEPHFLFIGFQWLPIAVRAFLVNHFDVGWYTRIADPAEARREVAQVRLLSSREVRRLFPHARFRREWLFGLVKSFIVYDGWDGESA